MNLFFKKANKMPKQDIFNLLNETVENAKRETEILSLKADIQKSISCLNKKIYYKQNEVYDLLPITEQNEIYDLLSDAEQNKRVIKELNSFITHLQKEKEQWCVTLNKINAIYSIAPNQKLGS